MRKDGIAFVKKKKTHQVPHAPQIRPTENYWGLLKMKVYEGNWSAKSREHLIWRIKSKQKEIDQNVVMKMFYRLKGKVHSFNENGLNSLIKT